MKNSLILAGAAALAFTAPVLAQPGKGGGGGNGNGGGKGGGPAAQVQKGGGGGGGPQMRGNGGGGGPKEMRGGGGQQQARGNGGGGGKQQMRGGGAPQREARGGGGPQEMRGPGKREMRVERQAQRQQQQRGPVREARAERGGGKQFKGNGKGDVRIAQDRGPAQYDARYVQRTDRVDGKFFRSDQGYNYVASPAFRTTGLVDGCPPGLAAKGNGCLPPGQAKKLVGGAIPVALGSALLPTYYRNWYPDNDDYYYRTSDDYVYRIDRDRNYVDAYWPLADDWNGAYYVGSAYPQDYLGYYNVPVQYQPWYADNGDDYYRYADGAIYQVDRQGGVIESIVSLLAGGFGVGQQIPAGYDAYNVPYDYRDRYVDNDEHMYRYNDGYIYDVDPTTQIVQAIVETLV
ncbi:hypothetical protein [Sphingomonas glaciei]|uniref:RcnB family protein n=1 Tax=Sphingomonas glaciei TaxID=2938948 RepID=A0ABY5MS53_9SPHN|nr:hypothetical protein [Sphingomonas glaciei]UUR07227.1 hypothetical protein M1K48_09765 [Sphingomonas glaciei]